MKQLITKKAKPIPLEFHKGCRNCKAKCKYNSPVTTKLKNSMMKNIKFGCNTSKEYK